MELDFALPFDVAEKVALSHPITVHACGCTCLCSGSFCTHDLTSNCGDTNLAPFDGQSCQVHRADVNKVLHTHNVAAAFLSCSGTIEHQRK